MRENLMWCRPHKLGGKCAFGPIGASSPSLHNRRNKGKRGPLFRGLGVSPGHIPRGRVSPPPPPLATFGWRGGPYLPPGPLPPRRLLPLVTHHGEGVGVPRATLWTRPTPSLPRHLSAHRRRREVAQVGRHRDARPAVGWGGGLFLVAIGDAGVGGILAVVVRKQPCWGSFVSVVSLQSGGSVGDFGATDRRWGKCDRPPPHGPTPPPGN